MAKTAYRCQKCRTRNCFKHKLEWYLRPKKCRACGHNRFYWDKERNGKLDTCYCSGYHFPHRRKSPFCLENPRAMYNELRYRQKATEEEILDALLDAPGELVISRMDECPF